MEAAVADVVCLASFNADLVSRVARPIARGETLRASAFDIAPGGKGSNAAVAAARQGARVALVARIGDDDFGRLALATWAAEGIVTTHVECAVGERTGVAQILVFDGGDNSIAVYTGAGDGLGPRHAEAARATIAAARVVMAPNEVPQALTEAAFRIARAHGVTTLLNPAPALALPDALVALCDVLTPNEGEARALAGLGTDAPVQDAAAALLARGARAVAVTLGERGAALFRPGIAPVHVARHAVEVVDTIGAGDTFTGALAAALARGVALDAALRRANAAAALSVTGRGALGGMPGAEAVDALLARG
jgi:ribokinase